MAHLFELGQKVLAVLVDRVQRRNCVDQEGVADQREPEVKIWMKVQQLLHQTTQASHKACSCYPGVQAATEGTQFAWSVA